MGNALGALGDYLGGKLNSVITGISNLSSFLGNLLSDIIGELVYWFGLLLNEIVDGIAWHIDFTLQVIDHIVNFFGNLLDFLISIFIPSEDYFKNWFTSLNENLKSKFLWIEVFHTQNQLIVEDIYAGGFQLPFIMGQTISFDWYIPYRGYIKGIIAAVFSLYIVVSILKRLRVQFSVNG